MRAANREYHLDIMAPLYDLDRYTGLDRTTVLAREWLDTNGLGDYASSTVAMCPTRRQHGLLVARPNGYAKRHVFLSRFEETAHTEAGTLPLSMAAYPDTWAPPGAEHLLRFELAPGPKSIYADGEVEISREIRMVHGKQAVLCRYRLLTGDGVTLELRPFLPFREADSLTVENDEISGDVEVVENGFTTRPYAALPAIHFTVDGTFDVEHAPVWYARLDLADDRARGYPGQEDHFSPCALRIELNRRRTVTVAASLERPIASPASSWKSESRRRSARLSANASGGDDPTPLDRIAATADDFLVTTDERLGIDAGYPWFGEWGRDTFIALPGLTLGRGDLDTCERVLSESLEFLQDGLLPNVFGLSRATSHYGSVDASLWFARAVRLYERAGGSSERILEEYLPALLEIATSYWEGTRLEIRSDEGGLIRAGSEELNATWMDARTASGPVTPRAGCAVEINALWYALLRHVELLLDETGERREMKEWKDRRLLAKRTFLERFWLEDDGYLADAWQDGEVDRSVRPNMVIAAALKHSPLVKAQRKAVVDRAAVELLTPRGLRTLSPSDARYRGRYEGDPESRDTAYHQGTVWPWLFGFYVEAALRGSGTRAAVRSSLRETWDEIASDVDERGLNHVSEVFDGDAPHRGGGTIAQAWSSAELLRAHRMLETGRP